MRTWRLLPDRALAEAVVIRPHIRVKGDDLPLDIGDKVFIFEQGGDNGEWFRGYLNQHPSLLSGLTPTRKGQGLEERVFEGTFPKDCVRIKSIQLSDDRTEVQSAGNGDNRDSLGQITSADKAQKDTEFTKKLLEQIETNTLPIPEQDPEHEKPQAPIPHLKAVDDDSSNIAEPLIDEIPACITGWWTSDYYKKILVRDYKATAKIDHLATKLDVYRLQMVQGVLTEAELAVVRERAIWKMNAGNKILNGEVIVRSVQKLGKLMDSSDSPIELSSIQSKMSLLNEVPAPQAAENSAMLNHILVDIKDIVNTSPDQTTLKFFLVTKAKNSEPEILTECFSVACKHGSLEDLTLKSRIATLFADLTAVDVGDTQTGDSFTHLAIKVDRSYVPIPIKPWEGRESASMSRESLATPFHAANLGSINTGKPSMRRSMMLTSVTGSVKNVFKSPSKSKSPTKLNTLQEAFEPPTAAEARPSTSSSVTPPGTPGKAVSRTVAVGVLNLTKLLKHKNVEHHAKVQLWIPSPAFDLNPQNKGSDWDEIIRHFIDSPIGSYRMMPTMDKVDLVIKPYLAPDSESLIRAKPTELSGVTPTAKISFSGAPSKPRNDIYVEIVKANFPEKALLSRASGSATALSQRSEFKNIQVRLEVHNQNGVKLDNVVYSSSNSQALTSYDTTVIEKNGSWKETIRLTITPEDIKGAHLVMFTSDAPGYPFAVSHLPLWHEDAFVRDGRHDLLMYKNEDASTRAVSETTNKWYLNLKPSARGSHDALTGPLSTLRIQTFLCSTMLSQDKVILGILNWKSREQAEVVNSLKQLLFCSEIEVVKLLNDVLDSLFAILVEHSENETFEDLAFTALVHVLTMAFDRRFNLSPLVDKYADKKFNFAFATPCLVRSFNRLLVATDPASSTKLRGTFKVTKHILRFINRGRNQMLGKEADIGITNGSNGFSNQFSTLFNNLNSLMRSNEPRLIANKTIAAQRFHTWLPELEGILSNDEIVCCAIDFIDAMSDVKGMLKIYKQILLIEFSKLSIFAKDKSPLLHNTVRWIKPYWGAIEGPLPPPYRDQVRLCCTILSTQIKDLGNLTEDHLPQIIDSYLTLLNSPRPLRTTNLSLLFPRSYPFPVRPVDNKNDEFDEALIELSAVFSAISSSEQGLQLDNISAKKEELANLVYNTLKMQGSILNAEAFPETWLSLFVYHHRSAMSTLSQVANVLLESFLPDVEELSDDVVFLDGLWKLSFQTLVKLVTSETLALETFSEQKRRAVWTIAGDVRKEGAMLLSKMWHAIGWETDQDEQIRFGLTRMGGLQVQFSALVPATLIMCMHIHEDLCATGTEMLKSMIASEWQLNGSVAGIKPVIIDALNLVFRKKALSEGDFQKNFINDLLQHFDSRMIPDEDPMKMEIRDLLYTVEDFLDLLHAVHASGTTDEAGQLSHRLALMEFLRDMDKTDTFIAYAHQLATVQAAAGNFTEAGLALRHHAELYTWDPTKILAPINDPLYPSQNEFERKELLYHEMVERFEEGKCWGMLLETYQELASEYEESGDFKKLARTHKAIGGVYEQIVKADRPLTKYFRVCYGGLGFADELKMNQYMHEGKPGQELAVFRDKIQEDYPEASFIPNVEDYQEQEGQYISIDICTPLCEMSDIINQRTKVPNVVKEFLATRHPQQFTITTKKVYAEDVGQHYIEQLVLYTQEAFPTISRRSQIVGADLKRLDAVETAIFRVRRVIKTTTGLEKRWLVNNDAAAWKSLVYHIQQEVDIALNKKAVILTRALLATADADEADTQSQVELHDHQMALKAALIDEAIIIHRIISNFAVSDAELVRTQGALLREKFEKTFDVELASIAPKPGNQVEGYQRPWNFPVFSNGNSQRTASPVKDNRASNLSTLGPLPSMGQKPVIPKSRTSSSMTSTNSSKSSMAEKPATTLHRAGSFLKQAFGKDDKDSDAASGKENHKSGKKPKRGPPVAFNGVNNNNSGAKSMKRRESDAASTKSSRKSMGSFSRHSLFGRNRANSNATEAITDDGNSEWTDEQSSRFVSNPDQSRGIFTGRRDRYISDSIRRDTSSVFGTFSIDGHTSLNRANLSQEQQVSEGAASRARLDSVTSVSTIYTVDLGKLDDEVSDVESPSKDSDGWGGYNYDTIRPVKPRSFLSPEKRVDLDGMFSEPSADFSAPGLSGVLGSKRSRPEPAYSRTLKVENDGTNGESSISISDMSFEDPDMSFGTSDVKSITSDEIREQQARRRTQERLRSSIPVGRSRNDSAIQIPPGLVIPPFRPRSRRPTVTSIGSLGSDDTNPFDPDDVPIRHYDKPVTRLVSLTESEVARKRVESEVYQERVDRESMEQSERNQEDWRRLEAEYDAMIAKEKQQEQIRGMEEMAREACHEFGPGGSGYQVPPVDDGYRRSLYQGGYYWNSGMEAPGYEVSRGDPRYRPNDYEDFSKRFRPAYRAGYNSEYNLDYDWNHDGGYIPAENPYEYPNMVASEVEDDDEHEIACFRFLPHNPESCNIPNCSQQACLDYKGPIMAALKEDEDAFNADIFHVEEHNPAGCYDPHCGQQACEEYAGPRMFSSPEHESEDSRLHDLKGQPEVGDKEDGVGDNADENSEHTPWYGSVDDDIGEQSTPPLRSSYKPAPYRDPMDGFEAPKHPGYHTMRPQHNRFMPPPMGMGPYGFGMHPGGYHTMGPQHNPFMPPPPMDPYGAPMHPGYHAMGPPPSMHPQQDPFGPPPMDLYGNPLHPMGHPTMHQHRNLFMQPPMGTGPHGEPMHTMGYQTMSPMCPPSGFGFPDPYQHQQQQMPSPYMQGYSFRSFNGVSHPIQPPPGFRNMDAPHEHSTGDHGNPLQHVFEPTSSPEPQLPEQWPEPPPGFGLPRLGGLLVSKTLLNVGTIHTAPSENDFLRWESQGLPFVETMRKTKNTPSVQQSVHNLRAMFEQPSRDEEDEEQQQQRPFQLFSSPERHSPGAPRMGNATLTGMRVVSNYRSPAVEEGSPVKRDMEEA